MVIDRIVIPETVEDIRVRVAQAIETCLKKADGFMIIDNVSDPQDPMAGLISQQLGSEGGGTGSGSRFLNEEMAPRLFSFNSPYGACPACDGLGLAYNLSEDLLVPDPDKSIADGAIAPFQKLLGRYFKGYIKGLAKTFGIPVNVPFNRLTQEQKRFLYHGHHHPPGTLDTDEWQGAGAGYFADDDEALWKDLSASFDGIVPLLRQRLLYGSTANKAYIEQFMEETICPDCNGARLKPFSLAVTLGGKGGQGGLNMHELGEMSLAEAWQWIGQLPKQLDETSLQIAREPLYEIEHRLQFLLNVGLHYLTLNRRAATLSGGEAQRIRLAAQLGAKLSGVLYVLDEPSIGLHPHNNHKLIETLKQLRDEGNSLIVVEHDEDTMRAADWLVDIGPKAGLHGGTIVDSGPPEQVTQNPASLTADFLCGKNRIELPAKRRKGNGKRLVIRNARQNNLKGIDVAFPLGTFTGVTGLSGSGKSSLVFDLLYPILSYHFDKFKTLPRTFDTIEGIEHLDKVVLIDQSPIGRSPRSNPATYTGLFDGIRQRFANTPAAKIKGLTRDTSALTRPRAVAEACKGDGEIKLQMSFLPDATTTCPQCQGKRFNPDVLTVRYRDKTIAEVLDMSVDDAIGFFEDFKALNDQLAVFQEVGLGYISLGQSSITLSGGEAQRIKLAHQFSKKSTGQTLYLLDEPTVGLHWHDLQNLLLILDRLVEAGNTVIVIEHNLELIKCADYLIELGPESGEAGGQIVAEGTPEQIAACPAAYTGQYLAPLLKR
ncbi:MAG: excinuclease ABC subunit UvrA [Vampirovibrionales bacterium]